MKDIKRYDTVDDPYFQDDNGMFVKYSDHKEMVDRMKEAINQLIDSNSEKSDEIKRLTVQIIGDKIMEGDKK